MRWIDNTEARLHKMGTAHLSEKELSTSSNVLHSFFDISRGHEHLDANKYLSNGLFLPRRTMTKMKDNLNGLRSALSSQHRMFVLTVLSRKTKQP